MIMRKRGGKRRMVYSAESVSKKERGRCLIAVLALFMKRKKRKRKKRREGGKNNPSERGGKKKKKFPVKPSAGGGEKEKDQDLCPALPLKEKKEKSFSLDNEVEKKRGRDSSRNPWPEGRGGERNSEKETVFPIV